MTEGPSVGKRSKEAPTVIRRIHKRGTEAGPLRGLFAAPVDGRQTVVEYEPDTDLRDTEQITPQEEGGIEAFLRHELLRYAANAWYQADTVNTGYEISFRRYFYRAETDADAGRESRLRFWRWRGRRKSCWERFLMPATSGRRLYDRNHLQSHRQNEVTRARGRGPRRFNELIALLRG